MAWLHSDRIKYTGSELQKKILAQNTRKGVYGAQLLVVVGFDQQMIWFYRLFWGDDLQVPEPDWVMHRRHRYSGRFRARLFNYACSRATAWALVLGRQAQVGLKLFPVKFKHRQVT
jgi:hypothetical protein